MKKIIFDCDNTMGIENRDIDDGLALIYLLNNPEVELLAITCTYGNDTLENVFNKTVELCEKLQIKTPVLNGIGNYQMTDYVGGKFINKQSHSKNKAAEYIVEMVNKFPNEISILATGSLQNIYNAWELDNSLPKKIVEIVVMGGITAPLYFNRKIMNELNFSIFSKGAKCLIDNFTNLSILTGNNCMEVKFTNDDLKRVESLSEMKNRFVFEKLKKWMDEFKTMYNFDSIVLWDVIAAIFLTNPELFENNMLSINSTEEDLKSGKLVISKDNINKINLPEIKSETKLNDKLISTVFGKSD